MLYRRPVCLFTRGGDSEVLTGPLQPVQKTHRFPLWNSFQCNLFSEGVNQLSPKDTNRHRFAVLFLKGVIFPRGTGGLFARASVVLACPIKPKTLFSPIGAVVKKHS